MVRTLSYLKKKVYKYELPNGKMDYCVFQLHLEGGAFLGFFDQFGEKQLAWEYQFFLSKTPTVDNSSVNLEYSGEDYRQLLSNSLVSNLFFTLNSVTEVLVGSTKI